MHFLGAYVHAHVCMRVPARVCACLPALLIDSVDSGQGCKSADHVQNPPFTNGMQ